MRPRCLITGCELVLAPYGATAHGDLHQVGGAYVFNAVRDESGETSWNYDAPRSDRVIYVDSDWFERKGVIVIAAEDVRLSDPARNFIESAP